MTKKEEKPWYHNGLRFKCTGCGGCCGGSPGFVFLTEEDEQRLAQALDLPLEEFQKIYTRIFMGRRSLIEDPINYDCVFLENNKCTLYEARPRQCKSFPFWSGILEKKEHWDEFKTKCEGIEHQDAPLISFEEIQKVIDP